MPLIHRKEPAGAHERIEAVLADLIASGQLAALVGRPVDPTDCWRGDAYPTFKVGRHAARGGRLLEAAARHGWRFLVFEGDKAIADVELRKRADGGLEALGVSGPQMASALLAAHQRAETSPLAATAALEPRLLKARAIHLLALWLHGDAPAGRDLLLPLALPGSPYPADRLLIEAEVLSLAGTRVRTAPNHLEQIP